jgi:hypothetical protein
MTTGVNPFILFAAGATALGLIAIFVAFIVRSSAVRASMIAMAILCLLPAVYLFLAFHPALIDGRFRAYKHLYREIQVGMTRDQVMAILDQVYPADGARKRPTIMTDTPTFLGFFMNPETSREPNCEGIFLTLDHGKVAKKVYSPD